MALNIAVYLWAPIAGMIRGCRCRFNCALPTTAASSQQRPDTSQKVIVPAVTGAPLAVTEAVKVTGVCHASDDEESVRVVVVGNGAACARAKVQATVSNSPQVRRRRIRFVYRQKKIHSTSKQSLLPLHSFQLLPYA